MTGRSLEDVVQQALDVTGMTDVPLEDRTVLLSDNGAGYISQQFNEYLRLVFRLSPGLWHTDDGQILAEASL